MAFKCMCNNSIVHSVYDWKPLYIRVSNYLRSTMKSLVFYTDKKRVLVVVVFCCFSRVRDDKNTLIYLYCFNYIDQNTDIV